MAIMHLIGRGKRELGRSLRRGLKDVRGRIDGLANRRRVQREINAVLAERAGGSASPVLPDFLIIGAPKCGTSWLAGALRRQPHILVVPDEIEYFSSHLDRPLKWYLAYFETLVASVDKSNRLKNGARFFTGEKSAGYCGMTPAEIRLVHRLLPDARLILMIRDPVKRHWSHAKRVFSKEKAQSRGYESLASRQQINRFFTRARRFSEFSWMIENWTDVYAADQLLVVSQETALAEPGVTFDRVLRHIGAYEGFAPSRMKHVLRSDRNQGPSVSMPEDVAQYLEQMFAGERTRLVRVLSERFQEEAVRAIGLP